MQTLSGQYARLLQEQWDRVLGGENTAVFFNVHDHELFTSFLDRWTLSLPDKGSITLLRLAKEDPVPGPYAPLLDWAIKRIWKHGPELKGFLEECGVYPPQIPLFHSYIGQGRAERVENVLHEELEYERQQAARSVWNILFSVTGDRPLLLILENLARIPVGTIQALIRFFEQPWGRPLFLIGSYNDQDTGLTEQKRILIRTLMETADTRPMHVTRRSGTAYPVSVTEGSSYSIGDGRDAFLMLALEDALSILLSHYREMISGKKTILPGEDTELVLTLGDTHLFLNQIDDALLVYQHLITLAQERNDRENLSRGQRRLGTAHLLKDDVVRARKMGEQALLLAGECGDQVLDLEARLLLFDIEDKKRKQSIEAWQEINDDLVSKTKAMDWENTLAYIYTNQYGTFSRYSERYRAQHDIGIEIAIKLKNEFRLAVSYQIKGLIASVQGEYDEVIRFYRMSEAIKEKMGNTLELAYIRNGIGFYRYMTGEYESAVEDFSRAIVYLIRVKEFHEIAMTWFNIAAAAFLYFDHAGAVRHLEAVLSMLTILDMPNLSYHSRLGIYVLLGTAYSKSGQPVRGYEYLTRIRLEGLKPYPLKNEEYFFYFLLRALLLTEDNRHREADRFFRKAEDFLCRTNDVITYFEPRFRYERAMAYHKQGNKKAAAEQWRMGRVVAEKSNPFYAKIFRKTLLRGMNPSGQKIPCSGDNFGEILNSCRTEHKLTQLHYRINEISFLNSFQKAMVEETDNPDKLVGRAAFLIRSSFPVEKVIHHTLAGESWVLQAIHPENPEYNGLFRRSEIIELLIEKQQPFLPTGLPAAGPDCPEGAPLISLPLKYKETLRGHLLCCCNPNSARIEPEAVRALLTSASQLAAALYRLDQEQKLIIANRKLAESATTDLLTGLGNRSALHERLKEEEHRFRRYSGERENPFSLLFLDLDNFKHYNDTFGHLIGDRLLVLFSGLLRTVCRDVDFIARYGGDEFIIILPETGKDGAVLLVQRLYEELERRRNFHPDLEGILEHAVRIPPERKLSFSAGVALYDSGRDEDLEQLLSKADRALYRSKEAGKNTWRLFDEEEDK